MGKGTDLEEGLGSRPLYPMMLESPELRWSFIRKVYSILSVQLLLTVAVAAVIVSVHPIARFFATTTAGLAVYIVIIILPLIGMFYPILFIYPVFMFFVIIPSSSCPVGCRSLLYL